MFCILTQLIPELFLEQLPVLGDFDKQLLIPYTTYEKEQKHKYRNDPTKLNSWHYDETGDCYVGHQGSALQL